MAISSERTIEVVTLQMFRKQRGQHKVCIERKQLFEDVISYLLTDQVENERINVEFKVDGYTEPAHDSGGLSREMFTLFFQECLSPERGMFEGVARNLLPVDNERALDERWFYCLGKGIVLSLVSGGAGFPYLSKSTVAYLLDTEIESLPDLTKDVSDKIRSIINEVEETETVDVLYHRSCESKLNLTDLLKEIKWPFGCKIEKNEKLLFTQMVLKWHLLDKRKRAMDQLKEGLNTLNFLEGVKQCSDFEMYLVHDQDNCVNSDFIRRQLLPKLADLDTKSENQEQIKLLASNCLMDISDNFVLMLKKEMLEFLPGRKANHVSHL
ncbi:hypothetical protein KUTeg_023346 [Tegillarca granosa]|uniref:HECT domain-containing protein n=1 Tax=Tegillarca granosa TaxID=220873 RepID=A0ABQ9E1E2_TEGGR|nr:hypothetical protein KUTeg_023346 [Tegillarca granosa]